MRPLIVAQSHQSALDPGLLAIALPPSVQRQLAFLGYGPYFLRGAGRALRRPFRIHPIDADGLALSGLRAARMALDAGRILVIYPEGERSWDASLRPLRRGVAWLADETGASVVPSAIAGAYQAAPRGWPSGTHPVRMLLGEPLGPPGAEGERAFLDELRARIAGLMRDLGVDPERGDPETWAHGPPSRRREPERLSSGGDPRRSGRRAS
jgi:1-acyl-sn-glycerol-3-phosphate acyltransferase